ncbi:MAG: NAD(P)/FAD-dependent oxidoreductase [Patulibacter sp.]|nr:NAD(P)/FAD-dependent oxidoreductase [Patulibacter sp.]
MTSTPSDPAPTGDFDAVVVGAGFSGLYALYRLRGFGFRTRVFEAANGVGGTWHWNRYPGARSDAPSTDYSYSFDDALQQEWDWSEFYPSQPELLEYLNHVADRFDLRPDIQLETRVTAATFDETTDLWTVTTDTGESVTARFLVLGTGNLSVPRDADFEGLDSFEGELLQTSSWPQTPVDLTGKRVGVIGTGSSGVQVVPSVMDAAAHTKVFQRTPPFAARGANRKITPEERAELRARYPEYRAHARTHAPGIDNNPGDKKTTDVTPEEMQREYEERWAVGGHSVTVAYTDVMVSEEANETLADFLRARIPEVVKDPKTAELLTPRGYPVGARRVVLEIGYYDAFNRDDVELVDVRTTPITRITPKGVLVGDEEHELDALILATGFDAMTGAVLKIDIRGLGGQTIQEKWAAGPVSYLGVSTAGFPNLLFIAGPGSPSVLTNVVVAIEQSTEWITQLMADAVADGVTRIDVDAESERQWVEHVNEVAAATLFMQGDSWYIGANVPGKPRVFMPYAGGVPAYIERTDAVRAEGYPGFLLTKGSDELASTGSAS